MACYDPNSLTASMTGELSVNLNATGGLVAAGDGTGIYVDFVGAKVKLSTAMTIANNSETVVTWDAESFDTDSIHDNVTNNTRLTVPTDGTYLITVALSFAASSTGATVARIRKNASNVATFNAPSATTTGFGEVSGTFVSKCVATDYFEATAFQISGSTRNVTSADSYFAIYRLPGS